MFGLVTVNLFLQKAQADFTDCRKMRVQPFLAQAKHVRKLHRSRECGTSEGPFERTSPSMASSAGLAAGAPSAIFVSCDIKNTQLHSTKMQCSWHHTSAGRSAS